jgi:hypothetical protein
MEVFYNLQIASPAAKREVTRTDENMGVVRRREDTYLWMKDARCAADGLDVVVATRTSSAFLAQSRSHPFGIGEDESRPTAASD